MTPKTKTVAQASTPDFATAQLKDTLRRMLREKGRTYAELAVHLDCSLATVKRILNHEELGLSRLLAICDWLDLSLADLEAAQALDARADDEYTEEQDLFLAADPRYLVYMSELWDGLSPEVIAAKYKLRKASTERYLLRLEQLGLVRVSSKGRVTPMCRQQPNWRRGGALAKSHFEFLSNSFLDFFKRRVRMVFENPELTKDRPVRSSMNTGAMSRETYEAMAADIRDVITRFAEMSRLESKIKPKTSLGNYALLSSLTWLGPEEPMELDHVFGPVTDL